MQTCWPVGSSRKGVLWDASDASVTHTVLVHDVTAMAHCCDTLLQPPPPPPLLLTETVFWRTEVTSPPPSPTVKMRVGSIIQKKKKKQGGGGGGGGGVYEIDEDMVRHYFDLALGIAQHGNRP